MKFEDYICRRLLESECRFPPIHDDELESRYRTLDFMYSACRDRMDSTLNNSTFPTASGLVELQKHYVSFLRGMVLPKQDMNVHMLSKIFLSTRCLIQFYNREQKGDFAMALCFWMRNFLIDCNIQWELLESYKADENKLSDKNVFYSTFTWSAIAVSIKLFILFYRLSYGL